MSTQIEIRGMANERVGAIDFNPYADHLNVLPTATGFNLSLPISISLKLVARSSPIPLLSNLRGVVYMSDLPGKTIEVGQIRNEEIHESSYGDNSEFSKQAIMSWRGTYAQLSSIEKIREGRPPQFQIQLSGELCYLFEKESAIVLLRSQPKSFWGQVAVSYSRDLWVSRLQNLGVMENVVVEIPIPGTPPTMWEEVWQSLVLARKAFEQGGETAWKACVTEVRTALEKWRAIENEDMGPGWKSTPGNSQDRTKKQRIDNLRWHLHQCTHHWVHNLGAECTRDDALLMLSTLSSLLAQRNP